jgi:hypothetical protein
MSNANNTKNLISSCPICGSVLSIGRLSCQACHSHIETQLDLPAFFRLPADLRDFVMVFLRCRGNIREVEKELGISYPTVCKRLDLVNELLGNRAATAGPSRHEILERLERGDITAKEAAQLLKGN